MHQDLFKIIDMKYVDDLLDGNLYMNTLDYFRRIEQGGNQAQQDPLEGVIGTISKNSLRQYGINFDDKFLNVIGGRVNLISDSYGFHNLFCLYQLQVDDETKSVQVPSTDLVKFDDSGKDSKVVVWIKNREEFLTRLEKAIQREITNHTQEYAIYGSVVYNSSWLSADAPGNRSAFHKEPSYAYQQEWRLAIFRKGWKNEAYRFNIGSLRDITTIVQLDDFLKHPETLYPGYTQKEDITFRISDIYRMFGGIHSVSKLMYSYMPQPPHHPDMTDKALADWHYTQYLILSGQDEKIEPYLEGVFSEYKDLEHLELLVQYRLSKNFWVKALEPFQEILENHPNVIQTNPEKFFYLGHQILMTHQQPENAAKFLKISEQYNLSDDLRDAMLSDCLLALGFHDKAAEIFEKMKQNSNDPILDYDLAVVYLHLLQFSKAEQHLRSYQRLFSHSQTVTEKTKHLENLITCFLYDQQLSLRTEEHPFKKLSWDNRIETALSTAKNKTVYLGIDSLYQIETYEKWDMLNMVKYVEIVPQTISRLLEIYSHTGNPTFYKIIRRLSEMKNLNIRSPKLDFFLAIDCQHPDFQTHYKAERGLLLEEQISNGIEN